MREKQTLHKLRIFAASASDTATERAKVQTVADALKPMADSLGIVLDVIDWRTVVSAAGRPEQAILDQLKPTSWDIFIGILWHRFGTPPGAQDPHTQKEYLSGTEEEFQTAYRLWQQHGKPRIVIYRCTRQLPYDVDLEQFQRVKDFFKQFEAVTGEHQGLYQAFETTEAFERLLLGNLQTLLLEFGAEINGQPLEAQDVPALAPQIPNNLPRRVPFFGRDKEMEIVLRALSPDDRTWGVLVDGIGGIGKTALATEAAHRCHKQGLFDAFIFVTAKQTRLDPDKIRELTPAARTLDEFLNETARVLGQTGIPKLAGAEKRRALLDALRTTRALLIYDNLETLSKDEQEAMADFLRELPEGCKAIITSRRRGGEGAVWLRLEKLDWEAARQIIAEEAKKDARLHNKLQRAGEADWHKLYDATGGSPLALAHTLGLMRVRASLTFESALEMLSGNLDEDLQEFVFKEACKDLTENDESALRALSFFVPSATFEAWMDVAELSRNALETTLDRLSALSLVDILAGEERYALHPLTRSFVRDELLTDAQIAQTTGLRFAAYWIAYAQRYGGRAENYKTFHFLEAEWANLEVAAELLWQIAKVQEDNVGDKNAAQSLNDLARALSGAQGPLFYVGRWDESLQLNARTYEIMRALGEWRDAGWRAYQVAWIHYHRARIDEAEQWTNQCAEVWKQGGSKRDQAMGMQMLGLIAQQRNDYDTAEQLFQDAQMIWRVLDSDEDFMRGLYVLGRFESARKQYDAAERYYREALGICEKLELKEGMAVLYGSLGVFARDRERWAEARDWHEKELSVVQEIGRQDMVAHAHYCLAHVHEDEGQFDIALMLAQKALTIEEKLQSGTLLLARELVERLKEKTGK